MKKITFLLMIILLTLSLFLNGCVMGSTRKTEINLTFEDKTELAQMIAEKVVELQKQQEEVGN